MNILKPWIRLNSSVDSNGLCVQHIPAVAELNLNITNIDVFCEEGVYNAEQTRQICEAGKVNYKLKWLLKAF